MPVPLAAVHCAREWLEGEAEAGFAAAAVGAVGQGEFAAVGFGDLTGED